MFAEQFASPRYAHSATPMQQPQIQYYQPTAAGAGTVQIMNVPQSMPQPAGAPSAAVPYGAQLRGVGIKFGCDKQKHLIRKCPHNQIYMCRRQTGRSFLPGFAVHFFLLSVFRSTSAAVEIEQAPCFAKYRLLTHLQGEN